MNCNNKFFHGYIKNLAVTFDFNFQKNPKNLCILLINIAPMVSHPR